jgi:hypothetical protein
MARKREYSRVHTLIDELPKAEQEYLDALILDPKNTYKDIMMLLSKRGHELSQSTVARRARRLNAVAARLEESRRGTAALIQYSRDNLNLEASDIATSSMFDSLLQRITTGGEKIEELPIEKAGQLLINLQRSLVYRERMKSVRAQACKKVEAEILRQLRERLSDKPDILAELSEMVKQTVDEEANRDEK